MRIKDVHRSVYRQQENIKVYKRTLLQGSAMSQQCNWPIHSRPLWGRCSHHVLPGTDWLYGTWVKFDTGTVGPGPGFTLRRYASRVPQRGLCRLPFCRPEKNRSNFQNRPGQRLQQQADWWSAGWPARFSSFPVKCTPLGTCLFLFETNGIDSRNSDRQRRQYRNAESHRRDDFELYSGRGNGLVRIKRCRVLQGL